MSSKSTVRPESESHIPVCGLVVLEETLLEGFHTHEPRADSLANEWCVGSVQPNIDGPIQRA